jgi:hypothetical protein
LVTKYVTRSRIASEISQGRSKKKNYVAAGFSLLSLAVNKHLKFYFFIEIGNIYEKKGTAQTKFR